MEDEEIIKKRLRRKEVIEEDRHNEIKGALKGLANSLNQSKNDGVADALKELAKESKAVAQAIKDIPKPETPDVNIEISQKEIVASLEGICKRIEVSNEKVIEALNNRPLVDKFNFIYDYGNIKTAEVIYKK